MTRSLIAAAVAALLVAGCSDRSPAQKAADDARDVAAVEAIQHARPPARPVRLEPLLFSDIQQARLFSGGCAFVPAEGGPDAVAITEPGRAAIKIEGAVSILASDPGSAPMPNGSWSRYSGKARSLTLTRSETGDGAFRGKLVVTNAADQIIYEADGEVRCAG